LKSKKQAEIVTAGASYGRGGGHGDSSHQSPHHHHGMQQQTTSSMKGPDPHQALLSAMSLSTSSVPLMLHNAKRQMSMMPGSSSSNHAHEAATAAYQHFLQVVYIHTYFNHVQI
jgi:hypothetical protein